ncbi:MAG: hypothetical protein KGY69_13190 [Bacteroidales bacterium]|nr:hypothetical protein [Bacteroidales bacterium]
MVTVQSLAAALQNYTIYYEVVPFRGEIDHERCRITINPVFAADAEILLHELLHVFYPNAPEEWIKEAAQDIIKIRLDVKNYLNDYCYRHARHSGSSLLAMMG